MTTNFDKKLSELGIELPVGSAPAANYANAVRSGNLLFIAGKAPLPIAGQIPKGCLGREFTTEDGYGFARSACIDLIAVMKTELGSLENVVRVVELQGFVNAVEAFEDHPKVMNGASICWWRCSAKKVCMRDLSWVQALCVVACRLSLKQS
jgi:enamine deaminase RidA (YjgF/YER057c/UK114 family)